MAKLVWTQYKQRKIIEAEELESQIMRIREEYLGKKHLDTLMSIAYIIAIYEQQ